MPQFEVEFQSYTTFKAIVEADENLPINFFKGSSIDINVIGNFFK